MSLDKTIEPRTVRYGGAMYDRAEINAVNAVMADPMGLVERIEDVVTEHTRGLLIPDLIGGICDWDQVRALADRHDLQVIHDSALSLRAWGRSSETYMFGIMLPCHPTMKDEDCEYVFQVLRQFIEADGNPETVRVPGL